VSKRTLGPRQLDTKCRISTAEHTAIHYFLAGIFERMVACIVDHIILAILFIIIVIISTFAVAGMGLELGAMLQSFMLLIAVVMAWLYFVLFEGLWEGKTPGKRMMRISVMSAQGTPLQFRQALVRNLLRVVDMLPHLGNLGNLAIPFYGLGFISCFVTRKNQRLGDLAAGTIVVQEQRGYVGTGTSETPPATSRQLNRLPAHIHFSRDEARAIVAFMHRANVFGPSRRDELVAPLAHKIRKRHQVEDVESNEALIRLCYDKYLRGDL